MPWKEPGTKPREPRELWGVGGRSDGGGSGFDFDARLRQWRRRLGPFGHGPLGVLAVVVLLIVLWFALGSWTLIGDRQVGIVLRFGRVERKLDPGRSRTISDQLRMMTGDGQLALVDYYVQYKVGDAQKFLFSVRDAEDAARDAATIAVRAAVGTHTLQQLMTRSGDELADAIRQRMQATMDRYDTGIEVTDAGIQDVSVPTEVKKSFDDIVKARQDARSEQDAARAEADKEVADARAEAAVIRADAEAYRTRTVAAAQADVARFDQVLAQYQVAPAATRQRLWLQAMQDVLSKNHVVINTGGGNVIVQLPPQAMTSQGIPAPAGAATVAPPVPSPSSSGPVMKGNGP